jgi:hypothetical protein
MGKWAAVENYSVEAFVPNACFFGLLVVDTRIEG